MVFVQMMICLKITACMKKQCGMQRKKNWIKWGNDAKMILLHPSNTERSIIFANLSVQYAFIIYTVVCVFIHLHTYSIYAGRYLHINTCVCIYLPYVTHALDIRGSPMSTWVGHCDFLRMWSFENGNTGRGLLETRCHRLIFSSFLIILRTH